MRWPDREIKDESPCDEYLVVDGYNIINAWPELQVLIQNSLEDARIKLVDILRDYQGYKGINIIIVFDAYMSDSGMATFEQYGKVQVVYTKKNETADHYIERWIDRYRGNGHVWVATSDLLEQTIVMSKGGIRLSARELNEDIQRARKEREEKSQKGVNSNANILGDRIKPEILGKLEAWRRKR